MFVTTGVMACSRLGRSGACSPRKFGILDSERTSEEF